MSISHIEDLIRTGSFAQAKLEINKITSQKLSRKDCLKVGNLAYRIGLPNISLRVLRRFVNPEEASDIVPQAEEMAEYAVALTRVGAVEEAIEMLEKIGFSEYPKALLYLAFAHISNWDYELAIPHLERYSQSANVSDYEKVVAKINLLASYIAINEHGVAGVLLKELLAATEGEGMILLRGNCLELGAQLAADLAQYGLARDHLQQAQQLLNESNLFYIFTEKWLAIVDLLEFGASPKTLAGADKVRAKASACGHFESIREIDLHLASSQGNAALFHQVYFGTPFPAYRRKIYNKFHGLSAIPKTFLWTAKTSIPSSNASLSNRTLDVLTGAELETQKVILNPTDLPHKLLQVLVSDFYRPFRVGTIFKKLFPGEFYDPIYADERVYQLVRRLKLRFQEEDVPLQIFSTNNAYRLSISENYALQIPQSLDLQEKSQVRLQKLDRHFKNQAFSASEAASALEVSHSSAGNILKDGVKNGLIEKSGSGKATRYTFKKAG